MRWLLYRLSVFRFVLFWDDLFRSLLNLWRKIYQLISWRSSEVSSTPLGLPTEQPHCFPRHRVPWWNQNRKWTLFRCRHWPLKSGAPKNYARCWRRPCASPELENLKYRHQVRSVGSTAPWKKNNVSQMLSYLFYASTFCQTIVDNPSSGQKLASHPTLVG